MAAAERHAADIWRTSGRHRNGRRGRWWRKLGVKLLTTFRTIEKNAANAASREVELLAALVQQDAAPRGKVRKSPAA
jgi:hypothetical protein